MNRERKKWNKKTKKCAVREAKVSRARTDQNHIIFLTSFIYIFLDAKDRVQKNLVEIYTFDCLTKDNVLLKPSIVTSKITPLIP